MRRKLQILVISDGKAGHENQSLGLAEAMARKEPAEISILTLPPGKFLPTRTVSALKSSAGLAKPGLVIAAGHSTHLPLLLLSRKYNARSILLMKPTLPASWFGWCVAPEHDFPTPPSAGNIITSRGALNRVRPGHGPRQGKLFLIGGPSKTHGYDEPALVSEIRTIAGDGTWQLADSRRTPPTFLPAVRKALPHLEIFPHRETQPGWLAERLAALEEVRVTEDSVSMIYEALTGGAKTGILPMPRLRPDNRIIRGLEKLAEDGYLLPGGDGSPPVLREADRCAGIILAALENRP